MPPVISVIGKSNSGKTTIIERLIPELAKRGLRVGTIKHHHSGRDVSMDVPGKDTWRHKQAGARVVALSSPAGLGIIRDTDRHIPPNELVSKYFHDVDLVITEGYKQDAFPKIEVYRRAAHSGPLPDTANLAAMVSDDSVDKGVPVFGLDDIEGQHPQVEAERGQAPMEESKITKEPLISSSAGVILAGGKSSRFGSNKALADFSGRPLIEHVAEVITGIFSTCLLVTNTPETYEFLDLPMTGDLYPGSGPLAGIHAALRHVEQERVFVVACDMPNLNAGLIRYLCDIAENEDEYDAVIPWPESGPEPLHGVYHRRALPVIEESLDTGERKIGAVLEKLRVRRVRQEDILARVPDLRVFTNINQVDDLVDED